MSQGFGSVSLTVFWLIAMIVLLVVEGIVPGLVSIWFAAGALVALVVSLFGAPLWLQVFWFVAVSVILFILTEDMRNPMVIVDIWTPLMLLILAGGCMLDLFVARRDRQENKSKTEISG